jgi:hypothetical protein
MIDMIDDPNEVEQDVLEWNGIREWNVSILESYRTNNHQEGNNYRLD